MEYVKSPLNYTGGKYKLLNQIIPLFPKDVEVFVDLFSGGNNVGVNAKSKKIVSVDKEEKVIELLKYFQEEEIDVVFNEINTLIDKYNLTKTSVYGYDHYGCESSGGVAKVNKENYLQLRADYNRDKSNPVFFYTVLIFAFNNQIRFNSSGNFNMPVNKRDFNKSLQKNLRLFLERLKEIEIEFHSRDFRELKHKNLTEKDFVYCDPPYLISNAAYNEQGGWTEQDEKDLLDFLDRIHKQGIKFALSNVLESKGKRNDLLIEWSKKYIVHDLSKDYSNSNYQTKNRDKNSTKEVLITNY